MIKSKIKSAILFLLIMGSGGVGDHQHLHDRHPSQSKVYRWSTLIRKNPTAAIQFQ